MIKKLIIALVVIWAAYEAYSYYNFRRAGLHTRPALTEGSFSLSFKSGLRAILHDRPDERKTRRYFGYPLEVPFYIQDAWSDCYPADDRDAASVLNELGNRPGERVEGICRIDVDGELVTRGFVTSVPRL